MLRIALIALVTVLFFTKVGSFFYLPGNPMQAGLSQLPVHFMFKAHFWLTEPRLGSFVAIRYSGQQVFQIAQIKAVPSQRLEVEGNLLIFPSGEVFTLSSSEKKRYNKPFTLAADEFFVFSGHDKDAKHASVIGRVKRERIIGEVLW